MLILFFACMCISIENFVSENEEKVQDLLNNIKNFRPPGVNLYMLIISYHIISYHIISYHIISFFSLADCL